MPAPLRIEPARRFLSFTVVRCIGRGAMGAVYEVIGAGGRRYALKVLQPTWQDRDEQVRRMVDEAIVMVGIKHINIVEVHDHGVHEGLVWMLMELVPGETLRARLCREGPFTLELACAVLRAAAYAAEQCHALGIVHRDIKPENFILTPDRRVKMLDFGLAHIHRSTVTRDPIGTPAYMAPEQFNTRLGVSPATDVYALGVMGYELLMGFNPFLRGEGGEARSARELCFEHTFTLPQPLEELGVPPPIAAVVMRALSKDPRARYPSGAPLGAAIWAAWKQVRDGEGAEEATGLASAPEELRFGTGPPLRPTLKTRARRSRAGLLAALLFGAALLVTSAALLMHRAAALPPASPPERPSPPPPPRPL